MAASEFFLLCLPEYNKDEWSRLARWRKELEGKELKRRARVHVVCGCSLLWARDWGLNCAQRQFMKALAQSASCLRREADLQLGLQCFQKQAARADRVCDVC